MSFGGVPVTGQTGQFTIEAYRRLWRIEESFRMPEHDQAHPGNARPREQRD